MEQNRIARRKYNVNDILALTKGAYNSGAGELGEGLEQTAKAA